MDNDFLDGRGCCLGYYCCCDCELEEPILSYCYSLLKLKDGRVICVWEKDIRLWNDYTMARYETIIEHDCAVACLIQLEDERLAFSSRNGVITIWNLHLKQVDSTLIDYNEDISYLLQYNSNTLISCTTNHTIKVWNLSVLQCVTTIKGFDYGINSFIKLKNGQIASSLDNACVIFRNAKTYQYQIFVDKKTQFSNSLGFSQLSDGKFVTFGEESADIYPYDKFENPKRIRIQYQTEKPDIIELNTGILFIFQKDCVYSFDLSCFKMINKCFLNQISVIQINEDSFAYIDNSSQLYIESFQNFK